MPPTQVLLDQGLYDAVEAARLTGVTVGTLNRWTRPTSRRPALLEPQLDPFFSFFDLLTLQVIRDLRRRGVPLPEIAAGIGYLSRETQSERPFAHQQMATSGRAWLADLAGDLVNVGKGGQLTFEQVIAPTLVRLEYGDDLMASLWRPVDLVWLNPRVQAGASCVDATRIPTRTIWDLVEVGEDVHDLAWQYEIELEEILAARNFERTLESREPLELIA